MKIAPTTAIEWRKILERYLSWIAKAPEAIQSIKTETLVGAIQLMSPNTRSYKGMEDVQLQLRAVLYALLSAEYTVWFGKQPDTRNLKAQVADFRKWKTEDILGRKAKEYAVEEDRMHSFNRDHELNPRYTPSEYCYCQGMKHWQCVVDFLDVPAEQIDMAVFDEKITDAINYLPLLEACLAAEFRMYAGIGKPQAEQV